MPAWIDLTGRRFGRLVALSYNTEDPRHTWLCLCDCGNTCFVMRQSLRKEGHTRSCGCLRKGSQRIDLTGHIYGRWTVLRFSKTVTGTSPSVIQTLWHCQCICGTLRDVRTSDLRSGKSTSCGCQSHDTWRSRYPVYKDFPEHHVWKGMRQRCLNPHSSGYALYGGRGISIDPRWNSFKIFYEDMGPRPTPKHTLERKNNDLGYSKENCIWATYSVQSRNTRQNHWITFNGLTLCITDWDLHLGYKRGTVSLRLSRNWSMERIVTTPTHPRAF